MPAPDLRTTIAGIEMKNPITVGSGTYGHHGRYGQFFPVEIMGALVPKTIRAYAWPGNPPPRVLELPAGLHSAVGIPCSDWDTFLARDVPVLKSFELPIIQSVIGRTEDEYVEIVARAADLGIFAAIELNLSCPNIAHGGLDFGYDPQAAYQVVRRSVAATKLPVIAKLAPDYSSLIPVARRVEEAGAAAISMINAPRAMMIDHRTGKPMIGNKIGSLSGVAIKSMAVYMIWEVYCAVSIPIFGMGGVSDWKDVVEFMAAGAQAVGLGTVNYIDPQAVPKAIDGLTRFMAENGIARVSELVGRAHEDRPPLACQVAAAG